MMGTEFEHVSGKDPQHRGENHEPDRKLNILRQRVVGLRRQEKDKDGERGDVRDARITSP